MIKVGVTLPATVDDGGDFLANVRALEAAGAHIVRVAGDSPDRWVLLGAIAAATGRMLLDCSEPAPESLRALCRGRLVSGHPEGETWVEEETPNDRESWAAMVRAHEDAGATGVIVPWDPRLVDLLRNPEPDDRGDLLMSTG